MEKMKMHSYSRVDANVKKIEALFPNCVTEVVNDDGKLERVIDFDALKEEFSTHAVEGKKERYQFTWPDKNKAKALLNQDVTSTLRPCRAESEDFDNTENLYIEGDNLEVLKLLQETYLGKIKMIYIDPPYNTGHDFIYNDSFKIGIDEYTAMSGEYDSNGNCLISNLANNGRFHTDWLNMIYPRLRIARDLLSDDGLIFISIDDNEQSNLKKMCDEIFGVNNFLTCISRATGTPTGGGFDGLVNELDYILVYAKDSKQAIINGLPMTEEDVKTYDKEDEFGKYLIRPLRRTGGEDRREDRPTMYYPLTAHDGSIVYPKGPTGYDSRWRCSKDTALKMQENNLLCWKKTNQESCVKWQVYQKFYLENKTKAPGNLWIDVEGNKKATRDIRDLFDNQKVFDFPKPIGCIKKIIQIATDRNSIVLDFFSGSATTAHSLLQLNSEDQGNRKFIMVQLPEIISDDSDAYKAGYHNLCDIGKERIRRAALKIKEKNPLLAKNLDFGFRVLKLDSSNMNDIYYKPSEYYQDMLAQMESNIKTDRTPEDLLFQVMLDLGVELSSKIDSMMIKDKEVFNVAEGWVMACFDEDVSEDVIIEVAKQKPRYFVMRDSSMAYDTVSVNFDEIFNRYSPETIRKVM